MKTALVVDDDASIRLFVHTALTRRGWVVLDAVDGVDGLARFLLHAPELLITDISMPNSDGLAMLEALRAGGDLDGVRVVIMSGVIDLASSKITAIKKDALLSKPFKLADLYAAVGE